MGTAYEDNAICTGYGAHMALPLIRDYLDKHDALSEKEAVDIVQKSMEILYYRDARSFPKYQYSVLNKSGVSMHGPIDVEQNWKLATMVKST